MAQFAEQLAQALAAPGPATAASRFSSSERGIYKPYHLGTNSSIDDVGQLW